MAIAAAAIGVVGSGASSYMQSQGAGAATDAAVQGQQAYINYLKQTGQTQTLLNLLGTAQGLSATRIPTQNQMAANIQLANLLGIQAPETTYGASSAALAPGTDTRTVGGSLLVRML